MGTALGSMIHKVSLQGASHSRRPVAASANEADATARKAFDRRDLDLRCEALGDDLAFVERNEKDAAHFFSPRLAAAIASRRLP
jgi:hypothetical protein